MRYRLLGNSGVRVSEPAIGTMTFGDKNGGRHVRQKSEPRTALATQVKVSGELTADRHERF